jgi:hypothetical protein
MQLVVTTLQREEIIVQLVDYKPLKKDLAPYFLLVISMWPLSRGGAMEQNPK